MPEPDPRTMAALATLNGQYQQVIRLRYLDGLSFEQTVTALGIGRRVLEVTLTRAIQALTRALGEPPDLPGLQG